jgi:hypothetical protein
MVERSFEGSSLPNTQTTSKNVGAIGETKKIWQVIGTHLSEQQCNHSLREIVKEAVD